MENVLYTKFLGTDLSTDPVASTQVSFLKCENFVPTRVLHSLIPRGGSKAWSVTGDIWGIGSYAQEILSSKVPVKNIPIRHRRTAAISYIEKLNHDTDTWDALSQGGFTSFEIGDITGFAQVGDVLAICGGGAAKITSGTASSFSRLGGPGPAYPPATAGTGTGITGTYTYYFTFRDSSTGWESSPSPLTTPLTVTNQTIHLQPLTAPSAREGVDKKRIYRTGPTGEPPFFLVAEIPLGDIEYFDSTPDSSLSVVGPDFNDHDPPPATSYVITAHEDRFWIVDAADPKRLYYSELYEGLNYNLEYFSINRVEVLPKRITGLVSRPNGGLLIFQPPGFGIWELSGRTESEFSLQQVHPKEGTNFKASVCTDGTHVAFWSEDGPAFLTPDNQVTRKLSEPTRNLLRPALLQEYNSAIFVWSIYSRASRQFIFGFSASDTEESSWVDEQTGLPVTWIDEDTGAVVDWILDEDNPPPSGGDWYGGTWYAANWYGDPWV